MGVSTLYAQADIMQMAIKDPSLAQGPSTSAEHVANGKSGLCNCTFPAEMSTAKASMSAKTILWRSNRPRWKYR